MAGPSGGKTASAWAREGTLPPHLTSTPPNTFLSLYLFIKHNSQSLTVKSTLENQLKKNHNVLSFLPVLQFPSSVGNSQGFLRSSLSYTLTAGSVFPASLLPASSENGKKRQRRKMEKKVPSPVGVRNHSINLCGNPWGRGGSQGFKSGTSCLCEHPCQWVLAIQFLSLTVWHCSILGFPLYFTLN